MFSSPPLVDAQNMESGGGRDDAARRAHLDKLWRIGMEISRAEVDRALLVSGLTRADMEGLDRDIYSQVTVRPTHAGPVLSAPSPISVFAHITRITHITHMHKRTAPVSAPVPTRFFAVPLAP